MDMNRVFERRHSASVERSDAVAEARDRWTADRTLQIVEALAGVTNDGRPMVYPSVLTVGRESFLFSAPFREAVKQVSVFEAFGDWLAEHTELLTREGMRDMLANPLRLDVRLFNQFAAEKAAWEASRKADDFFDDGSQDWEAA
jgi:hypothetical protein